MATAVHGSGQHDHQGAEFVLVSLDLGPGVWLEHRSDRISAAAFTSPNHVHLLPAGTPSSWAHQEPVAHLQLNISSRIWESVTRTAVEELEPAFARFDPTAARDVRVLRDAARDPRGDPVLIATVTRRLVARLHHPPDSSSEAYPASESTDGPRRNRSWLSDFKAVIDESLQTPMTVQDLADAMAISPVELSLRLRELCGGTPYQFLTSRRVAHAQHLLTESDVPLAEIAGRCGFYDQAHLTRHFSRQLGTSPAAYRRATARGSIPTIVQDRAGTGR